MEYKCEICIKKYSSYQSLWIHNKKFHNLKIYNNTISNENSLEIIQTISSKLNCRYCNKLFKHIQNRHEHEKKVCKIKEEKKEKQKQEQEQKELQLKKEQEQNEINILKNEMSELKSQLTKMINTKKSYSKINKTIINNTINNNTNSNNNTTSNNNTVINNTFVKFNYVVLKDVLSQNQIINNILSKPAKIIEQSIRSIHFNKDLPEYNNIHITNMQNDIAHTFDGEQFIAINKNDMIKDLIDNYTDEVELYLEENEQDINNKLTPFNIKKLKDQLNLLNDTETKYRDVNTTYINYKAYKNGKIKKLIYNLSDAKKLAILNSIELIEKKQDL
jgi:hypothetical protein